MIEIFIASVGLGSIFAALVMIGYVFLKKRRSEGEKFARNHAEDAMRIKSRQFCRS